MKYNPNIHHRRSIRLKGYDYSRQGLYFITICTQNRECFFGKVIDGEMRCNGFGEIARDEWLATTTHRPYVVLHEFVVMPNHVHGIIEITHHAGNGDDGDNGNGNGGVVARNAPTHGIPPPTSYTATETDNTINMRPDCKGVARNAPTCGITVPTRIAPAAGSLAVIIRAYKSAVSKSIHKTNIAFAWQRNYYEHIIRNEQAYINIEKYIRSNPERWEIDKFLMENM